MTIAFCDEIDIITVLVDSTGVNFLDGMALFSDIDGKDYEVPVINLISIV